MITHEATSVDAVMEAQSAEWLGADVEWTPMRRHSGTLSAREAEVAAMAARGLRNREIGARLGITEGTVKIHLHNVYDKLRLRTRSELIIRARDAGLV